MSAAAAASDREPDQQQYRLDRDTRHDLPGLHDDRDCPFTKEWSMHIWEVRTVMDRDDAPVEGLPLRDAARHLVRDTPEGRALEAKLEALGKLDGAARQRAVRSVREDIADIVAQAVTAQHQHAQMLDALEHFRNDRTLATSTPAEIHERHPMVGELLEVVEDILSELGREMLIEVLLPGAHVLLPPTDFVASLFTAVEMFEIAEDPWHWP